MNLLNFLISTNLLFIRTPTNCLIEDTTHDLHAVWTSVCAPALWAHCTSRGTAE